MRDPVNDCSLPHRRSAYNEIARRAEAGSLSMVWRSRRFISAISTSLGLLVVGLLGAGCSSGTSTSKVEIGAIAFTDVNGTPQTKPPTTLTAGQSTYVDITLTGDPQNLGADWSVYCGSAPPPGTPPPPGQTQSDACGTFTPVHTMSGPIPTYVTSGAGYVTLYTAPAAPPANGTVTLYAAATSNPSRWTSVTLTVVALPISVGLAPPPPATLATGATTQIKAVVNNDAANAGVSWTTICASSDCGSFNPAATASGVITTYTAPAAVPDGGTVQVVATSVTDPTKSTSATITITGSPTSVVKGSVRASLEPLTGSTVGLYAAITQANVQTVNAANDDGPLAETTTDENGNFEFPDSFRCPALDTQVYLLARGGSAGGGNNPDLALMAAAGPCSQLASSRVTVNEATTVAAVYALNGLIADPRHVGSKKTSPDSMAAAFATARELVDVATGVALTRTASGGGVVPQAKINTLANLLSTCARTAGSTLGDGNPCDQIFSATNPDASDAARATDTIQALLNLARNATGFRGRPDCFATLYTLATERDTFEPALTLQPKDWTLAIVFPQGNGEPLSATAGVSGSASYSNDAAGNLWVRIPDGARMEFIGDASYAGGPATLFPIAIELEGVL